MRTTHDWTTLVVHMLRISALALWFAPAAFLASPLTADDLYGAPNPGWYNQGSGSYSQQQRASPGDYGAGDYGYGSGSGSGSGGYGDGPSGSTYSGGWQSGAGSDTEPGYGGYEDWSAYRRPEPPAARPDAPEPISPNGYGAPDWAQEPIRPEPQQRDDLYGPWRDPGDSYAPTRGYAERQSPWRAPQERPRYRFRDDPDLERGVGSAGPDLRFRPLTKKERERLRGPDDDARYADPDRDRGYSPRRSDGTDDRGTAFGYEPPHADDFYRRYYRGGR
jgi:hypothetical protein